MTVHQISYKKRGGEPPKISNITFAILPFYQKKLIIPNGHSENFGVYYSWWNHQLRLKIVNFFIKKTPKI